MYKEMVENFRAHVSLIALARIILFLYRMNTRIRTGHNLIIQANHITSAILHAVQFRLQRIGLVTPSLLPVRLVWQLSRSELGKPMLAVSCTSDISTNTWSALRKALQASGAG